MRSSEDTLSELEALAGRPITSVEDLLCFVAGNPTRAAGPADTREALRYLRQGMELGALAIAYLYYYFSDISLRIAALPALEVLVPPAGLG